jgi:hypothetical protein
MLVAILPLLLNAAAPLSRTALNSTIEGSVVLSAQGVYSFKAGLDTTAAAWGTFEDTLLSTGWGVLDIRTSPALSDVQQHHAAGYLEGALTAKHIHNTYINVLGFTFHGKPVPGSVLKFMNDQDAWARAQVKSKGVGSAAPDPFWEHVGALLAQYDGMIAGYASSAQPTVPVFAWQLLNGVGDLFQIIPAVEKSQRPDWGAMTTEQARATLQKAGHCSALVKVTGDLSELFMGHSSWFEYANTNRIYKNYHFAFKAKTGANRISFSSYPGYLESLDDFYMMDSGLGMVQTSNGVPNNTLLDLITPQTLLAWQRVRVASAMASTGEEWWSTFKTHASGTYVNQYMVVDFKQFVPGAALPPGTLWVVEEIPGLVKGGDQTATLARGYWPSYNVPYYAEVYERSGYKELFSKEPFSKPSAAVALYDGGGDEYTIGAPRAKLFRRDNGKVTNLQDFKDILRYANYSDPYAIDSSGKVNYGAALCMRGDLESGGQGGAGGCYDTKVTSSKLFSKLTCEAVSGPSSIASSPLSSVLPPFAWRPSDTNHHGLPAKYAFPIVEIAAKSL